MLIGCNRKRLINAVRYVRLISELVELQINDINAAKISMNSQGPVGIKVVNVIHFSVH